MKNKSSWEMTDTETIYNKKERIARYDSYQKNPPKGIDSKKVFLCWCGQTHSWSELGKKHQSTKGQRVSYEI